MQKQRGRHESKAKGIKQENILLLFRTYHVTLVYVGSSELWRGGAGRSDLRPRRRDQRNRADHR